MTTQYTPILKLALPVQGELSGTWGDTVNDNITSMVEEAIAGRSVINSWTANSHTLTTADGTTAESRAMMLEFTDTGVALTGAGTVICPAASKVYICKNSSGQVVTIKTSGGTGVAVPNGATTFVFCDGTNVEECVTNIVDVTVSGTITLASGVSVSAILDEDNMASNSATALATQQSIKAYVDSQVTAQDLDIAGDTGTGAVDLDSQSLTIAGTANEIETSASGQTVTVGLPTAIIVTTITTTNVQATNVKANDGTTAITIADTTGQVTVADAVLTTADINGGTADDVTIGATTPAAGSFTTLGASGTTSLGGALALTGNLDINTNKFNVTAADGNTTIAGTLGVTGNVDLNGGTIDGTVIGGSSAAAGSFTTISASGEIAANGGVAFGDNNKATFGASDDLQIYHDGSNNHTFVKESGSGNLYVQANNLRLQSASGGNYAQGIDGDTFKLYFNDAEKLATTSTGIDVTGTVTADGLTVDGAAVVEKAAVNYSTGVFSSPHIALKASVQPDDNDGFVGATFATSDSNNYGWSAGAERTTGGAGDFVLTNHFNSATGTQAMRLHAGGDISFYEDTGTTAKFFWDASAERLGIGTSSPSSKLDIVGATEQLYLRHPNANELTLRVDQYGTTGTDAGPLMRMYDQAGNVTVNIDSRSGSTRHTYFNNGGGVGIGTSSPSGKLDVNISTNARGYFSSTIGEVGSGNFALQVVDATGASLKPLGFRAEDIRFATGSSERMRIDSSGNVGIGTSSPGRLVDLKASDNTDGARLRLRSATAIDTYPTIGSVEFYSDDNSTNSSGIVGSIDVEGIGTWNGAANNAAMTFNLIQGLAGTTSPVEAMRIDSSGNVNIYGTDNRPLAITSFNTASAGAGWDLDATSISGVVTVSTGGSERMRIDSSGNVGIGVTPATDWSTSYHALQLGTTATFMGAASGSGEGNWISNNAIFSTSGSWEYLQTASASSLDMQSSTAPFRFRYAASGTAGTAITWSEAMRIDSSGNLLVGKTSSSITTAGTTITGSSLAQSVSDTSTNLATNGGAVLNLCNTSATNGNFSNIGGYNSNGLVVSQMNFINVNHTSRTGAITLSTHNGTSLNEAMRIDSSGNLLVGKTASNSSVAGCELLPSGIGALTANGNQALYLNRLTSDGDIVEFRKDGTTVGSIGVASSYLTIGSPVGSGGHLLIGNNLVHPATSTGASKDASIDIGGSSNRFKDLYLSGGAYLGGTAAANKLDDYEEGSFTPVIQGATIAGTFTYGTQSGLYTKIGNVVSVHIAINVSATTVSPVGAITVQGLPFSTSGSFQSLAVGWASGITFADQLNAYAPNSETFVVLRNSVSGGNGNQTAGSNLSSSFWLFISGTYRAT